MERKARYFKKIEKRSVISLSPIIMNNQPRTYGAEIAAEKEITESISYIKSSLNESQYQEKL